VSSWYRPVEVFVSFKCIVVHFWIYVVYSNAMMVVVMEVVIKMVKVLT